MVVGFVDDVGSVLEIVAAWNSCVAIVRIGRDGD